MPVLPNLDAIWQGFGRAGLGTIMRIKTVQDWKWVLRWTAWTKGPIPSIVYASRNIPNIHSNRRTFGAGKSIDDRRHQFTGLTLQLDLQQLRIHARICP
jgi:hypothetical protein